MTHAESQRQWRQKDYYVDKRRNYDGCPSWVWVLWIDDYAWDSYATEDEAWAAADRHNFESTDNGIQI